MWPGDSEQLLTHLSIRISLALDFLSLPLPRVGRVPIFNHINEYNILGDEGAPTWKKLGSLSDVMEKSSFPRIDHRDLRGTSI